MNKLQLWQTLLVTALTCILSGCGGNAPDSVQTQSDTKSEELTSPEVVSESTHAINLDEKGHALRGFDAVEYRANGKAIEGNEEFVYDWAGAKWLFNNEANLTAFKANPENYAPANGGFCTFGVVLSKKFDGDPSVWSMQNDKLYVFLNEEVKEKFFQDLENNLAKVDDNWVLIKDKSPKELE